MQNLLDMSTKIDRNLDTVLEILYEFEEQSEEFHKYMSSSELVDKTELTIKNVNDAVILLKEYGFINWFRSMGTAPYEFSHVRINARGKYENERRKSITKAIEDFSAPSEFTSRVTLEGTSLQELISKRIAPPTPVGSPYGFTKTDWDAIINRKGDRNTLGVVMGLKFESKYYNTPQLIKNLYHHFQETVNRFNLMTKQNIQLDFTQLRAGYAEHLFNRIARDIIASDIALFDTSDLAPNVFLEIGVALTWGIRVFLIKAERSPKPASDISGQTWVEYVDNGLSFQDPEFEENLFELVEKAIGEKG